MVIKSILGFRVLVKPIVIEEKTAGGIVLPNSVRESDQQAVTEGEIVMVGPNCRSDASDPASGFEPKVGDRVLFPSYVGNKYYSKDKELFFILKDEHIMAIL